MITPVKLVIPALANSTPGLATFTVVGRVITCYSATAKFYVKADNGHEAPLETGQRIGTETSREFSRLAFYNYSGNAIQIDCAVSDEVLVPTQATTAQITTTVTAKDPFTGSLASPCPANATTAFNGINAGRQRKQFIVWNDEPYEVVPGTPGQNITLCDGNGNPGTRIPPQSSVTLITNAVLQVLVPAGAQPGLVLETFYS